MLLMMLAVVLSGVGLSNVAAAGNDYSFMDPFGFADARLMGMGYSYVAVWDAPNPLYSNPASFGLGKDSLVFSLGGGWTDGTDPDSFKFIAVSDVERGAGAGGFAWGGYQLHEGDTRLSGNTFNYSVGKSLAGWGALGLGLRYLRGDASEAGGGGGGGESVVRWRGLAMDAGVVLKYSAFSLGVIARDVNTTRLAFDDGTTVSVRPSYSAGLSLRPASGAVLAFDAHRVGQDDASQEIYTGGFEGWLTPHIALRGGIILGDGEVPEARAFTGGIGLRFGDFEMSYALLTSDEQIRRQCITLTRRF
jgi:hypothetical protein